MEPFPHPPLHSPAPPPPQSVRALPRATLDLAPVGIAQFGLDGRILYASAAFGELLGVASNELVGRTFAEAAFPADRITCEALNMRLAEGSIPGYRHEQRVEGEDGSVAWRRVTVSVVRDARGAPTTFVAVAEDASEQRASQAARREAEERLHAALDASRTGTFRWDIPSNRLAWDENLNHLFGLAGGETARTLGDFLQRVHQDDRARVTEAVWLCASDEQPADFDEEFRVVLPGGAVRWLHDRGRTIIDDRGLPLYMTGACVDVTDRKETEAALQRRLTAEREAHERAERAIAARDEVLAIVAHDLRNPLSTIAMSASMLLVLGDGDEERSRHLGIIQRAATAMDHLIRDLLEVSRMEAGGLSIRPAPQDVRELLEEVRALFEPQAQPRGIELDCAVDPGVPPLMGDRERLLRALSNLVGNALKFTPEHGSVRLVAGATDDQVEISVTDTGAGISPEDLPHVFDRFWQAERGSRAGAGLGLAIAQGIAHAHGGRINVESLVGKGTTFRLILPVGGPGP